VSLFTGLLKDRVASHGQFSGTTFVCHIAAVTTESVKDDKVICSDKEKDLSVIKGFKFHSRKILAEGCGTMVLH
jgi:hypothetical protein